jgi:glycosyltransferase involved in cell wall biosynthesis
VKILFTLLNYGSLTGSELYVYELVRELSKKHTCIIQSNITKNELYEKTLDLGVRMIGWTDKKPKIDVIHASQIQPTVFSLANYDVPVVQTIHSEIMPEYESPIMGCSAYIAIRPEIQELIKSKGYESELIYNPFDTTRFTPIHLKNKVPTILFAGPIDFLRSETIKDLLRQAESGQIRLIGVGRGWSRIINDNTKGFEPVFDVQHLLANCDMTAGIKLGRSTIEGWLMGKPGIVYDVDNRGKIVGKSVENQPDDLSIFDSKLVAEKIERIYVGLIYPHTC